MKRFGERAATAIAKVEGSRAKWETFRSAAGNFAASRKSSRISREIPNGRTWASALLPSRPSNRYVRRAAHLRRLSPGGKPKIEANA